MPSAKIHLTDASPRCSSCFGQYPERLHVDFGAAWDGPFLGSNVTGGVAVSIDDLIICEDCLKTAARELGLVEPGDMKQALMDAAGAQEALAERLQGAMAYIRKLEEAASARDNLEEQLGLKAKGRA